MVTSLERIRGYGRRRATSSRARFAFPSGPWYPRAAGMRLIRSLVACALAVGLSGCGPSISALNARPQKY